MEIEVIRAFERILIVMFSGISVILGWHLFKIGVVDQQSASLSGKGYKFTLQKVGPGVFFSLFGSVVMSIALINGLTKTTVNDVDGGKKTEEFRLANSHQQSDLGRLTTAINTLDLVVIDTSSPYKNHREAINKSIEILRSYRDRMARQKFKGETLRKYQQCIESANNNPCRTSKTFKEVEKWFTDALL